MIRVIFTLGEQYQTPGEVVIRLREYEQLQGKWIEAEASHNWVAEMEAEERSKTLADDFLSDCMVDWRVEETE